MYVKAIRCIALESTCGAPNSESLGHAAIPITLDTWWHAMRATQGEAATPVARLVLSDW